MPNSFHDICKCAFVNLPFHNEASSNWWWWTRAVIVLWGSLLQLAAANWTLLLFYGTELSQRPVITLFARVFSLQSVRAFWICLDRSCFFKRCLGTTKLQLMATWTSWKRPQGRTWTPRMKMAWLPPYWLLSTDMSMPFSSYAAESKHDTHSSITCASSRIPRDSNNLWP